MSNLLSFTLKIIELSISFFVIVRDEIIQSINKEDVSDRHEKLGDSKYISFIGIIVTVTIILMRWFCRMRPDNANSPNSNLEEKQILRTVSLETLDSETNEGEALFTKIVADETCKSIKSIGKGGFPRKKLVPGKNQS